MCTVRNNKTTSILKALEHKGIMKTIFFKSVCVCVCVCMCVCECMFISLRYKCVHPDMISMSACACACVWWVCTCVHVYICTCVCVCVCVYVCVCVWVEHVGVSMWGWCVGQEAGASCGSSSHTVTVQGLPVSSCAAARSCRRWCGCWSTARSGQPPAAGWGVWRLPAAWSSPLASWSHGQSSAAGLCPANRAKVRNWASKTHTVCLPVSWPHGQSSAAGQCPANRA